METEIWSPQTKKRRKSSPSLESHPGFTSMARHQSSHNAVYCWSHTSKKTSTICTGLYSPLPIADHCMAHIRKKWYELQVHVTWASTEIWRLDSAYSNLQMTHLLTLPERNSCILLKSTQNALKKQDTTNSNYFCCTSFWPVTLLISAWKSMLSSMNINSTFC